MKRNASAAAGLMVAAILLLSACSSPEVESDGGSDSGASAAAPSEQAAADDAGGGSYGCTDAMLTFMDANGYADPTPHDVSGFSFPEASNPGVEPVCYVEDDFGSAKRKGAIFVGDTDAAFSQIGAALTAAGYQQNEGYGTGIWWLGGDDPSTATYTVGAGPQEIDGQTVIWATWAS